MANGKNGKPVTLADIREELRMANRLLIANLASGGVQQKDIAAIIDRADSVVSGMFPKGLLRRLGRASKSISTVSEH
jgi:hypothetical protein